jgi:lauroyl/myristoyl acyltransferase
MRGELVSDVFAAHFANQYVGVSFAKCDRAQWDRYLAWDGLARLERARARGRGVVAMHPHTGAAQLAPHVLGVLGWPVHQVGGGRVALELSAVGRWATATRARLEEGFRATRHDGARYLRPVLRALEAGAIVFTACDGTGGGDEIGRRLTATVLGQPMHIPVGPAWLAERTGAALIGVRVAARGALPYQAIVGEEIQPGVPAIAAYLDAALRADPGDWLFWDAFAPGGLLA